MSVPSRSKMIASLNDSFRQTFKGGRVFLTAVVANLGEPTVREILIRVQSYSDFGDGIDPYGEHDFGSIKILGARFFWKIDYFDETGQHGSEDPADSAKTTRVMTIMLAEEY